MILEFLPNRNSLKVTVPSASSTADCSLSAEEVWPEENEIDLSLALLTQLKILMSVDLNAAFDGIYYQNEDELNPALGNKSNKLRDESRKS
jgi:hypothetical protein